jgi:uncharacterized protein YoxC
MIEVKFHKGIPTEPLIQDLLATFKELKGDRNKINLIAPAGGNPDEYLLQVKALLPRAKVIEVIRQQAKKMQSQEGEESGQINPLHQEEQSITEVLSFAMGIPGAKEVIEAALAIMGLIDDTINAAGKGILGSVAELETAMKGIQENIEVLNAGMQTSKLQMEETRQEVIKKLGEVQSQITTETENRKNQAHTAKKEVKEQIEASEKDTDTRLDKVEANQEELKTEIKGHVTTEIKDIFCKMDAIEGDIETLRASLNGLFALFTQVGESAKSQHTSTQKRKIAELKENNK